MKCTKYILICAILVSLATSAVAYDATLAYDCAGDCLRATGFWLYQRQATECSNPALFSRVGPALTSDARSVVVAQLQPGLTYCWYVTAFNNAGESGASNTVVFQVPVPEQPPGAPTQLRVIGPAQITAPLLSGQRRPWPVAVPFWLENDGSITTKPKRK